MAQRTSDVVFARAAFSDLASAWLVEPAKCLANDHIRKDKFGTHMILAFRAGLVLVFNDFL